MKRKLKFDYYSIKAEGKVGYYSVKIKMIFLKRRENGSLGTQMRHAEDRGPRQQGQHWICGYSNGISYVLSPYLRWVFLLLVTKLGA